MNKTFFVKMLFPLTLYVYGYVVRRIDSYGDLNKELEKVTLKPSPYPRSPPTPKLLIARIQRNHTDFQNSQNYFLRFD